MHLFRRSPDFFSNQLFRKKILGIPSVLNSLIQIRSDILCDKAAEKTMHYIRRSPDLGPNCLHLGHQQTLVDKELIKARLLNLHYHIRLISSMCTKLFI